MDAFCKGMDLTDNARERCVHRIVEVYLVDALVAVENVDHERLGKVFYVTKEHFLYLQEELLLKVRLSEAKQSSSAFTNQIRFVLACLIGDLEV